MQHSKKTELHTGQIVLFRPGEMLSPHAATGNGMTVLKVCKLYNLLRSANAAAVEKHLMVAVFSKGQNSVITIGLPDLLLDFLSPFFLVYPVQIPHHHSDIFPTASQAPQRASRSFQSIEGISQYP